MSDMTDSDAPAMQERSNLSDMTDTEPGTKPLVSKLIVIGIFASIIVFGVAALITSLAPPEAGGEVVESPFKAWDGVWEGEFTTYAWNGEPVRRLKVRQTYEHVYAEDNFRQEGRFVITDLETGETTTEKAINTAQFNGSRLKCQVLKDNGKRVVTHRGRIEDGYIFWSHNLPGDFETFREWIDGDTYFIEGYGIYGDRATAQPLLMVGRYRRVTPQED